MSSYIHAVTLISNCFGNTAYVTGLLEYDRVNVCMFE